MRLLIMIFTLISLTGCSFEERNNVAATDSIMGEGDVRMRVAEVCFEDDTKTNVSLDEKTGLSFSWAESDKVGVYSQSGGFALFNLTSGGGTSNALFNGAGFKLNEGDKYYAFYPYDGNATDRSSISMDYSSRIISEQNNLKDIVSFDFMSSEAVADKDSYADFVFGHLSSFVRLDMTLPRNETVTSIDMIPTFGKVPDATSFDLNDGSMTVTKSMTHKNFPVENITSDKVSAWIPMAAAPMDDAALVVNTSSGRMYSTRVQGKEFKAGMAYRWNVEAPAFPTNPAAGFSLSTMYTNIISSVPSGQYSGITRVAGNRYALVHDKMAGGGIIFFDVDFTSKGSVSNISYSIPSGTSESSTNRDPEGIVYVPSSNTLFVAGEADQQILEYDLEGRPTGRRLEIPEDMTSSAVSGNYGFESLGYNENTGLFWTTTENVLSKDNDYYIDGGRLLRLQSFSDKTLKADKRFLYRLDQAAYTPVSGDTYAYGVPDILALNDGRLIVMEREAYVPSSIISSCTTIKFYLVDPVNDKGGILSKTLIHTINTPLLGWANYEGICLGPQLVGTNGTILIVNDSQDRYKSVLVDYLTLLKY